MSLFPRSESFKWGFFLSNNGVKTFSTQKPKLLDQMRQVLRTKHYSKRTEEAYVHWIHRFINYHNKRHPKNMGEKEIGEFLCHLAVTGNVAASAQNQALCAVVFLYKHVLEKDVGQVENLVWAKCPQKLPEVFTPDEVNRVLSGLQGIYWLMGILMYGAGLRIIECLRLRGKDIDFNYKKITVREGKGEKDRITMLPELSIAPLKKHLEKVKELHDKDLRGGFGTVYMPYALAKKFPNANKEWGWKYIFPATRLSVDPRSAILQRHHFDESAVQRAVKKAIQAAGIHKHASCHTLRHSGVYPAFFAGPPIYLKQDMAFEPCKS